jgi:hypothetical protein
MENMIPSARRLLSISAVLMLLTAALHTAGNLAPASDPSQIAVQNVMKAFRFHMGLGMNPSMFDAFMALVLIMTVTFSGFGVLNLALAADRNLPGPLLRRVVRINVLWVAVYTALCAYYRIPPPLICGILIEIPLVAALLA